MPMPFTDEDVSRWNSMVGQKVWKNRRTDTKTQPKPFKSGLKVNTVRDVKLHPITNQPAFAFDEDESLVECFRCSLAPEGCYTEDQLSGRGTWTRLDKEAAELLGPTDQLPVFAAMKVGDGFEPTHMHEGIIFRG